MMPEFDPGLNDQSGHLPDKFGGYMTALGTAVTGRCKLAETGQAGSIEGSQCQKK